MNPVDRRPRLDAACLYVVTDARAQQGDLAGFLDEILGAGVDIVQLREKEAEAGDLLRWGEIFAAAAERHGALFIVNDRPDVALAIGADGVHVGQNDLPVEVCRRILGPDGIVGLSTHRPEEWDAASSEADYLCAGPVWETPTKAGRPGTGLDLIRYAAERGGDAPWFAIGGIDRDTVRHVTAAGARRIVVVRAIRDAPDPGMAAAELRSALERRALGTA